jgi:hypothetical protein
MASDRTLPESVVQHQPHPFHRHSRLVSTYATPTGYRGVYSLATRTTEHVCLCTVPGCKCKVMTYEQVCSLVGEYSTGVGGCCYREKEC